MQWADLLRELRLGAGSVLRTHQSADLDDVVHDAAINLLRALRAGRIERNPRSYAYGLGKLTALRWREDEAAHAKFVSRAAAEIDTVAPSHEARVLDAATVQYLAAALGDDLALFTRDHLDGRARVRKTRARQRAEALMGAAA